MANLLPEQLELLGRLAAANRQSRSREPFLAVRTFGGESVSHPGLSSGSMDVYWGDLIRLAELGLITVQKSDNTFMSFDVSAEGVEYVDLDEASTTEYFHVEVEPKDGTSKWDYEMDLSEEQALSIWRDYRRGSEFHVNGRLLNRESVTRLRVVTTANSSEATMKAIAAEHKAKGLTVLQYRPEWHVMERGALATRRLDELVEPADVTPPAVPSADRKSVWVVHGRNLEARAAMFGFLRSVGLKPLEWSQASSATGSGSPYVGQVLDTAFAQAQAFVILMTPDDVAQLQGRFVASSDLPYESELTGQARPNVLFEAGMAMGHDAKRTVLVELGQLRPFSNVFGRHTVKLSDKTEKRLELLQKLEAAGCDVDRSGQDWLSVGEFEDAIAKP